MIEWAAGDSYAGLQGSLRIARAPLALRRSGGLEEGIDWFLPSCNILATLACRPFEVASNPKIIINLRSKQSYACNLSPSMVQLHKPGDLPRVLHRLTSHSHLRRIVSFESA